MTLPVVVAVIVIVRGPALLLLLLLLGIRLLAHLFAKRFFEVCLFRGRLCELVFAEFLVPGDGPVAASFFDFCELVDDADVGGGEG